MASDRSFRFWQQWLFWGCVSAAGLGLVLAFFDTRLVPFFAEAVNQSVWGGPSMPADVVTYHRFVHAVLGATVTSWAVILAFVVHVPFRAREPWAWWCVCAALIVWFPLDTGMSLYWGVWPNAALNLGAFGAIALPLVFTRRAFVRPSKPE